MPRYLLFAGEQYYPRPGWHDWRGCFSSVQEAKDELLELRRTDDHLAWAHIVDTASRSIVWKDGDQ